MTPALASLSAQVRAAREANRSLAIIGGNTKHAWWRTSAKTPLDMTMLSGIIKYQPSELVLRAYAGTTLAEIEAVLAERGQMLAFEPPQLGNTSTIGGVIAAGLSGPARAFNGAVRDHVLGVNLMNADGEVLKFGGDVMKNVAGYDISRLVVGAWGKLGPITEVALRVAPRPVETCSVRWNCERDEALQRMCDLQRRALPISGLCYVEGALYVRLSGSLAAITAAQKSLSNYALDDAEIWPRSRNFSHPFYQRPGPLWRVIVPPATAALALNGEWLIDWGGALRWYRGEATSAALRQIISAAHGHVQSWPGVGRAQSPALSALSMRVVASFNPNDLFNPNIDSLSSNARDSQS